MRGILIAGMAGATLLGLGYWVSGLRPEVGLPTVALDHDRPMPQGDFLVGAYPEPQDLNPFTTVDAVARRAVLRYTHESLMAMDPASGELAPALAESMTLADDGLTLTFSLRPGVLFADGSPVTMQDVLFTHALAQDPNMVLGTVGDALSLIKQAKALDDGRLQLQLKQATFAAVGKVATGYIIVQKAHFQGQGKEPSKVKLPGPGTGPYQLVGTGQESWQPGQHLTLVQNPHCWQRQQQPRHWNLAGMRLLFVKDPAARYAMLRQEKLDWISDPDAQGLLDKDPELAAHYRPLVYDYVYLGYYLVIWNHRRPGLQDPKVRRALTMLFDRQSLVSNLLAGNATLPFSWFRTSSPHHPKDLQPLPHDPVAARQALAEAGFDPAAGKALHCKIAFAASQPLHRRILEMAVPSFQQAGVELQAQAMEWSSMEERLRQHDFDGMLLHFGLEPWNDPYPVFHSSQAQSGRNFMGYANAEVDHILETARTTRNLDQRQRLFQRFNEIFQQQQPVTLLAHPLSSVLLHRRFENVQPNVLGLFPQQWWVKPEQQRH